MFCEVEINFFIFHRQVEKESEKVKSVTYLQWWYTHTKYGYNDEDNKANKRHPYANQIEN